MNILEALALFDEHDCYNIVVRHKTSKVQYCLSRDVVECSCEEFVYGYFIKNNPRRKQTHKWFYLKSVDFVSAQVVL